VLTWNSCSVRLWVEMRSAPHWGGKFTIRTSYCCRLPYRKSLANSSISVGVFRCRLDGPTPTRPEGDSGGKGVGPSKSCQSTFLPRDCQCQRYWQHYRLQVMNYPRLGATPSSQYSLSSIGFSKSGKSKSTSNFFLPPVRVSHSASRASA
jgi:hypothetical protein